jgi:hypothetical protein
LEAHERPMFKIQGQPDLSMAVAPQAKLDQFARCLVALPFIVGSGSAIL